MAEARKVQTPLQTLTRAANMLSQAMELRHCRQADIQSALILLDASNPALLEWLHAKLTAVIAVRGEQP